MKKTRKIINPLDLIDVRPAARLQDLKILDAIIERALFGKAEGIAMAITCGGCGEEFKDINDYFDHKERGKCALEQKKEKKEEEKRSTKIKRKDG